MPVSDPDWEILTSRFAGLRGGRVNERGRAIYRSEEEIRRMFNLGLPSSPLGEPEKIRFRTIVRERVREVDGDVMFNDPYFELEWMLVTREDPNLLDNADHNRETLWNAFYARSVTNRQAWRRTWFDQLGRPMTQNEVDYGDTLWIRSAAGKLAESSSVAPTLKRRGVELVLSKLPSTSLSSLR